MLEMKNKVQGLRRDKLFSLSLFFFQNRVSETCFSALKWGHGAGLVAAEALRVMEDNAFPTCAFLLATHVVDRSESVMLMRHTYQPLTNN